MRSKHLMLDFWQEYCDDIFGLDIFTDTKEANLELGDTHLESSAIYFTNGVEDGWKWAGVMELPETSPMRAEVIDCENCAHCVDLYTESDSDAPKLK
jgi:hypothetical protein